MPLSIDINSVARTSQCDLRSLSITQGIVGNAGGAEMVVHVPDRSWRPKAANVVVIATSSDAVTHFGGVVTDVEEEMAGLNALRYRVTCKDYTYLFDRMMVTENYLSNGPTANLNVDTILAHVVTTYTTGFSTGTIQAGLGTVAQQRYDYVYPSDVGRGLADQVGALFWIDSTKGVHLQASGLAAAPIATIDLDSYSTSANWSSFVIRESAQNIKNRIVLQGYKVKSTVKFANAFAGDGAQRFFPLGYEASSLSTGEFLATLNAVTLTPLTDNIDASPTTAAGSTASIYVCFVNQGVRTAFAQSSTEVLSLSYNYMKDSGFQSDDAAAQAEMVTREGGDGVHMYMVNDPSLGNFASNDDIAIAKGQAITQRYGKPLLQGEFDSIQQGWAPGQSMTVSSTDRMGGFTKQFYVYQIEKTLMNHPGTTGTPTWNYHIATGESFVPL